MRINDIINEMTSAGAVATVAMPMTKKPIKRPGVGAKKKDAKINVGKGIYEDDSVNDSGMIGKPDAYYDEDERKQAYNDLQDALDSANSHEHDYVVDGICPECGGSSYMDGDYEGEEDSCYGWGNYGCDEGEMEGATWKEIMDHDKRQAERQALKDKPQPSDEELERSMKQLHKDYVESGKMNAFELPSILRQMYPEISKPKAREIGARFLKSFNESISELKKLAGIQEGEERMIISDATVDHLVDVFSANTDLMDREALEQAIYSELSSLDVEDVVDPDMVHGGQRMGDFASGRVIDVVDSGSIIDDVISRLDLDEGKSPHKKGTKKYKAHMAAMHAGG